MSTIDIIMIECTNCGHWFEYKEENVQIKHELHDTFLPHRSYKIRYVECPECQEYIELTKEKVN